VKLRSALKLDRSVFVWCALLAPGLLWAGDANWPQFRGPRGDGTTTSTGLPLQWGERQHVKWKTPIHGRAWSSPVVWGGQVWLTTATEKGHELYALCVNLETGRIERDLKLFEIEKPQYAHPFNTYGSPTPVIEEGRVYVTFGAPGTACLDTRTGATLWERRDFVCNHYRGAGSSPILYSNLFIVNFDGSDHQYIVALDKRTGRTVWEKKRSIDYKDLGPDGLPMTEGDLRKGFGTCHIAPLDGVVTLLSQGSKALYAYDPLSGEELWRVEERLNHSASTRPVVGQGLVFVCSGWATGQLLAVRPGRKGEVVDANSGLPATAQLRVVWKTKRNVPKKPSLLLRDDLLYGLDDIGVVTCWEARTGQVVWSERVSGNYSASLLAAEGRIYLFSEEGKATVVAAGRAYQKLAENQLSDGFMASPAVSGSALLLRTKTALYRIE
jgi:outer membrane protein assembly factor BamB